MLVSCHLAVGFVSLGAVLSSPNLEQAVSQRQIQRAEMTALDRAFDYSALSLDQELPPLSSRSTQGRILEAPKVQPSCTSEPCSRNRRRQCAESACGPRGNASAQRQKA